MKKKSCEILRALPREQLLRAHGGDIVQTFLDMLKSMNDSQMAPVRNLRG